MPLTKQLPALSKNLARVFPNLQRHESSFPSLATSCSNVELEPDSQEEPLQLWEEASLYVHWPYCKKRCTYCNFNKYVVPSIDQDRMRACLVREAQTLIKLSGIKRVNSIFFGGGTPSLAEPRVLKGVIDAVRELVVMPADAEISMEANPTSVEMKKLEDFKIAGINRLSLGIQALNNDDLKTLGREHTASQSLSCIREAQKLFPERLSIDIIFGRPYQTLNSWKAELEQILHICDNHISLYQLTLEPGTLLYKLNKQGILPIPEADVVADMYETAVERLSKAGFHRYEVSNFSRNARAESTHNKAYWAGKQYIGVGPGAHGRFSPITEQVSDPNGSRGSPHSFLDLAKESGLEDRTKQSTIGLTQLPCDANCNMNTHHDRREESAVTEQSKTNVDSVRTLPEREARIQGLEPEAWMLAVEKYGHATRKRILLSTADVLRELLLTSLRTQQGVSTQTWHQFRPGISLKDLFGSNDFVAEAQESGLLELDDSGLRCAHRGLNVLDSLLPDLTEILDSHYKEES